MQGFALRGSCAEQTTVQGALRLQEKLAEHPRVDLLRELHHQLPLGPSRSPGPARSSPRAVTTSSSLVPHRDHPGAQQHLEPWGSLAELPPCTWGLLLTQHISQTPCLPWAHPSTQPGQLQGALLEKKAQGAWVKSSVTATCWRLGQHLKEEQPFSSFFIFFDKQ